MKTKKQNSLLKLGRLLSTAMLLGCFANTLPLSASMKEVPGDIKAIIFRLATAEDEDALLKLRLVNKAFNTAVKQMLFKNQRTIRINDLTTKKMEFFKQFKFVFAINISKFDQEELNCLGQIPTIRKLNMSRLKEELDYSSLGNLNNLTSLYLKNINNINLSPLLKMTELRSLYFDHIEIKNPSDLKNLTKLTDITFESMDSLDLSKFPLKNFPTLTTLNLGSTGFKSLAPLKRLKRLRTLNLGSTPDSPAVQRCRNFGSFVRRAYVK